MLRGAHLPAVALAGVLGCAGVAARAPDPPAATPRAAAFASAFDPARIAADLAWLADPAREGRGLGTAGLDDAAQYLAEGFDAAGLEPGGDAGGYLQTFPMPVALRIAGAELAAGGRALERGADFEALARSASGEVESGLVFAGYGITAPELGYDDYAGVDARGRVVLILDYRPQGEDSPFEGAAGVPFLSVSYKLLNAREHGAAAVLLAPSTADVEGLPGLAGREWPDPTTSAAGILALAVSRRAAEGLVGLAGGPPLVARQADIDASGTPAPARLDGVRVRAAACIERTRGRVANVIGVLPGADPGRAHEAVVIGAHYDHLGLGAYGSLAPQRRGEVHPGADDNASGAAGLLALARAFAAEGPGRRTLVLAAFTAEEVGLYGSAEYVRRPAVSIEDTVAMLNLDMIGRLRDGSLTVFGTETSPGFESLVSRLAAGLGLSIAVSGDGYGPSDQTSFYARDVAVLHFFTGPHAEYHTPDDVVGRVDAAGTARTLRLVHAVARELVDAAARPEVVRATAPAPGERRRGYGPYLGTVPDFGGPSGRGVRLQGVRAGSPAEVAGLRGGDVIVAFDGTRVTSLEEYAALLFAARAGAPVEIVVLRDGARVALVATLGQRR